VPRKGSVCQDWPLSRLCFGLNVAGVSEAWALGAPKRSSPSHLSGWIQREQVYQEMGIPRSGYSPEKSGYQASIHRGASVALLGALPQTPPSPGGRPASGADRPAKGYFRWHVQAFNRNPA